ncbi:MAG: GAF domain-containing sensor histidine kinase [Chloroflexi bacterium]|nr:GAF domain-containing sensor histidine kinase [Chloroflexota bacterium]
MFCLEDFFQGNIVAIYFIYGLGIFLAGFALFLETGRTSQLTLARALPFLAAFGITHGIHEWGEMFLKISELAAKTAAPFWAEWLVHGLEVASFLFLTEFGTRLLRQLKPELHPHLKRLTPSVLGVYLTGIFVFEFLTRSSETDWLLFADLWARYITALPGTLLACWALLAQRREFLRDELPLVARDLVGATLALAWYALLEELIGPPSRFFFAPYLNSSKFVEWFGIPIEAFRVAAVVLFAFFIIRVMRVFEFEYARRLEAANRARFVAQAEANRELAVMFETCRSLGTTLELQRLLDDAIRQIVTSLDPMRAGMIYLYDAAEHALVVRAQHSRNGHAPLAPAEKECAHQTAERAFKLRTIGYLTEPKSGTSMLAVPLIVQEQPVGALCLAHREAFSNYPVIHTLARQLSIAIENAELYQQVQEKEALRGQLLERAVAAQEEERKRIARELHDETGQTLTALAVGLGAVEETMPRNSELAKHQLSELKILTMNAIENLRQLVSDLRPSVLDDMGLVPALRWFGQQYSARIGIPVEIQVVGAKRRLSSQVESVLFRIAQESLTNIARHAHATRANVRLEFLDARVALSITDDGGGFDVEQILYAQATRRAWGLLGVQERVGLVGGKFKIDSAPGKGTRVIVEIPVGEENSKF